MINYRTIFNPSYNFIGLLLIIVIIILIIWNNHNLKVSFYQIGSISLFSSLFTLIISFLIKFILNEMIPYQYKLFIQVISENVFKYSIILSIMGIVLGLLFITISKFFFSNQEQITHS